MVTVLEHDNEVKTLTCSKARLRLQIQKTSTVTLMCTEHGDTEVALCREQLHRIMCTTPVSP